LIAGVCAKLIEAPKADAKSVRAAILQMREQLIAAMIEKNWDTRQLREWLAAQGVDVPLESLGRYLRGIRAARKTAQHVQPTGRRQTARVDSPTTSSPNGGRGAATSGRVIPPMPIPSWKKPSPGDGAKEIAPRATSFPVRPDTEDI
jgi:hypothetical protein